MKPSLKLPAILTLVFLAWLFWLGLAVLQKDRTRVLSRAQLAAATHLVVADVQLSEDGQPAQAKVIQVIKGPEVSGAIQVMNLPSATPPGVSPFPGPGAYLLPLIGDGQTFRIAGLPRSPGMEPQTPTRPSIYVWDSSTQNQLKNLGLMK